jgi:hypothetical protein
MHAKYPAHLMLFDLTTLIIFGAVNPPRTENAKGWVLQVTLPLFQPTTKENNNLINNMNLTQT